MQEVWDEALDHEAAAADEVDSDGGEDEDAVDPDEGEDEVEPDGGGDDHSDSFLCCK